MKSNNIIIFSLIIFCSCSFYSLTGSIPAHLNNVVLQPTINNTTEYNVGKIFENKFSQLLINKNLLTTNSAFL